MRGGVSHPSLLSVEMGDINAPFQKSPPWVQLAMLVAFNTVLFIANCMLEAGDGCDMHLFPTEKMFKVDILPVAMHPLGKKNTRVRECDWYDDGSQPHGEPQSSCACCLPGHRASPEPYRFRWQQQCGGCICGLCQQFLGSSSHHRSALLHHIHGPAEGVAHVADAPILSEDFGGLVAFHDAGEAVHLAMRGTRLLGIPLQFLLSRGLAVCRVWPIAKPWVRRHKHQHMKIRNRKPVTAERIVSPSFEEHSRFIFFGFFLLGRVWVLLSILHSYVRWIDGAVPP